MELVCLVGRHGSGKSTIGAMLERYDYKHLSVGMLRRLARQGKYPADVPISLMLALRRMPAGGPMPTEVSAKLLEFAKKFDRCVIDGFPANVEHVEMLPADTQVALVWCPEALRIERLNDRAAVTVRQWTAGRMSDRENSLAAVIAHCRRRFATIFIANRHNGAQMAAQRLVSQLRLNVSED